MNKLLFPLLAALLLAACGNSADTKYNEIVTADFLRNVQRLDTDWARLIGGQFDAGQGGLPGNRANSPEQHLPELEHNLNQVQTLSHSEDASRYATSLSHYYELQIGYYQQLKRYTETRDKASQEAIAEQLNQAYRTLKALPPQVFAAQKQFLDQGSLPH
ncbi:hypothetical protein ACLUTX_07240 [Enterobacterales bacterium AE_CKDN230030158-1A_HGKHYDSX7]